MSISTCYKQTYKYIAFVVVSLSLVACGGGSGSSSNEPVDDAPKTISGKAQKGAFLEDSDVVAYQLDDMALRGVGVVNAKTTDDLGSFSITPTWNDWTEISVTGRFFNEDSAATSATELTLKSLVPMGQENLNINLFTHLVAERTRQLLSVDENTVLSAAYNQAQSNLRTELSLLSLNIDKMDTTDGAGSLKNDNAILLLFSGGFMANNGNAASLLGLTDDFANNGKIDNSSLAFFQGISNYAGVSSNLVKLSDNLKQAGIESPPTNESLEVIPKWVNQPPLVTIDPKVKTIVLGQSITMDATASIDPEGGALTFSWAGAGTEACDSIATCELVGLGVGAHQVTLIVKDEGLGSTTEIALITVVPVSDPNNIPSAVITPDELLVSENETVIFDASQSNDPDGDILSYSWNGPGTENCGNNETCTLSNLNAGIYYIGVTVSDNSGGYDSAISKLTVSALNRLPVAYAGIDSTIEFGQSITLDGSGSVDYDGDIASYVWKEGATILGSGETITLSSLAEGTHNITLEVTDNEGGSATDLVRITVNPSNSSNQPPTANAGEDKTIFVGDSVVLDGSASNDPDGNIASFLWKDGTTTLGSGETITLSSLEEGTHSITLEVTDNEGDSGTDLVIITVNPLVSSNQPPVANAGLDRTIFVGESVVLNGSASSDPDGSIASFLWKEGITTLGSTETITLGSLSEGTHTITLEVTDNEGKTASDVVVVSVLSTGELVINTPTAQRCTFQLGSDYLATYSFIGGVTGTGNVSLQKYSSIGTGCSGTPLGAPVMGPLTYRLTNIRTVNSVVVAMMEITAFGVTRSAEVNIVNGVISLQ